MSFAQKMQKDSDLETLGTIACVEACMHALLNYEKVELQGPPSETSLQYKDQTDKDRKCPIAQDS